MKDLILITSYCPDDHRENILRNLVYSLEKYKSNFEVMVVSHTPISLDIQKKVEFCFYDKKNEILTDWDLLNQPWFIPSGGRRIQSSFLSKKNTHLAIWRLMILGFSNAKNLGFSKVHHIEYDCEINEISEFLENSRLLNENNSVVYMDIQERISPVMFGSFQSYFIPKIHELLVNLNEEKIKDLIRHAISKSPEGLLKQLIDESGNVVVKNRDVLKKKGNRFGIINSQSINKNPWSVPYYDYLTETVDFISWNTSNKEGIEYKIIINNTNLVYIPKVYIDCWTIRSLGKIEEINSIIVLENEIIRDTFYLNSESDRELFKKMSYRVVED
jgi:hypothetical protein